MSLGERISELRKQRNYSQEYLAEKLNISRQAVYKWEKNLSSPDTSHLMRLAEIFEVSVDYLLTQKTKTADSVILEKSDCSGKKRNYLKLILISLTSVILTFIAALCVWVATRPVSWDAGGCNGSFGTHIYQKYSDELLEKYINGTSDKDELISAEAVPNSNKVIWNTTREPQKIVVFFDVKCNHKEYGEYIEHVHFIGRRIWIEKYIWSGAVISDDYTSENYYG